MHLNEKTVVWGSVLVLATAFACSSTKDGDGGDGDGDSSGGTSSGPGGETASGGMGPSGSGGGFSATGGMGGDMDPCGDSISILTESQTTYADFEGLSTEEDPPTFTIGSAEAGIYWYDDGGGGEAVNDFATGIEGEQALHVAFDPTVWGAGTGFYSTCVDASVFTGISFWARGQLSEMDEMPVELQVELHVPETTSAGSPSGTGDCLGVAGVTCFANKTFVAGVTDTWTQFFLTWDEFTEGSNQGMPVALDPSRINGLNFHVPGDGGSIDFYVDDIRFTTEDTGMGGGGGQGGSVN